MPNDRPWDMGGWSGGFVQTPTGPGALPVPGSITIPGVGTGGGGFSIPTSAGVPSNLAQITNLINSLNQTAQQSANAARIPNAAGLEGISSTNIQNELRGIIPDDVLRLLQQQAAERGAARGIAGSPNESAAYLRALGLTSLDLTDRGQKNLAMALGRNPAAPIFDPTGLIMTPFQSGQLATDAYRLALQQQEIASQNALRQAQIGQTIAETGQVGKSPTPWWIAENDTSGNWYDINPSGGHGWTGY